MSTKDRPDRHLVVVDVESSGLVPGEHVVLEVAALDTVTGHQLVFAPWVQDHELAAADPEALAVNRWHERGVQALDPEATPVLLGELFVMLNGQVLAGSNPAFDAAMLGALYDSWDFTRPRWHHRLADLAPYAAGVLGLPITAAPGLDRVCELLEVEIPAGQRHTALGDAVATAECFRRLTELSAARAAA
jgi:DNA polymerase III epsilon subunit-like protein